MAAETVKADGLPARDAPLSEGARPRLIIEQLVTQNFKSYAEVQTIGPFHEVRFSRHSSAGSSRTQGRAGRTGAAPAAAASALAAGTLTPACRPFAQNFSAIVGPNGSGKSNVIDALLFVFGKRAKQIRMSKVRALAAPRRQPLVAARWTPAASRSCLTVRLLCASGLATHP